MPHPGRFPKSCKTSFRLWAKTLVGSRSRFGKKSQYTKSFVEGKGSSQRAFGPSLIRRRDLLSPTCPLALRPIFGSAIAQAVE